MSKLGRRSFLLGRFTSAPKPEKAAPNKAPLPSVISWLSEYTEAAEEAPQPPWAAPSTTLPIHRPPGAIAEDDFLKRCDSCGACEKACPHQAIRPAPGRYRQAAGTPHIDAHQAPCRACEDMPCISACDRGALHEDADVMGSAQILAFDCLNSLTKQCDRCVSECPVEGAIEWQGRGNLGQELPRVYTGLCIGCGVCHHVCPAPQNAVILQPNASRKTPVLEVLS